MARITRSEFDTALAAIQPAETVASWYRAEANLCGSDVTLDSPVEDDIVAAANELHNRLAIPVRIVAFFDHLEDGSGSSELVATLA